MSHWLKSNFNEQVVLNVTPESANWQYLSFQAVNLKEGQRYSYTTEGNEIALVPLSGRGSIKADGQTFDLARQGVFSELPHVLYLPPNRQMNVEAKTYFEFAIGCAPAKGKYPTRLFLPEEIKCEVRGGGSATRQVNHILSHPLPAERLILFEVYVPPGQWSGWPPHCHDGYGDSAYLEEMYYFRTNPENGFAFHRNYRLDNDFDEIFPVEHTDLVLVTQGFHSTASSPGTNLYFLNYLAGDLLDDARATPPYDDPRYAWIKNDWTGHVKNLPIVGEVDK